MITVEYRLENTEPIKINDGNLSGTNQLETLKYITGSAIRGYVVSKLDAEYFAQNKKAVLSSATKFYNAYPTTSEEAFIPSPRIYYAAKNTPNKLISVLDTSDISEMKRADTGDFCTINGDEISCTKTALYEDLNNNITEKLLFRSRFIGAGQHFVGYVCVENDNLADKIIKIISDGICIGASKSKGFGRCKCIFAGKLDTLPYNCYRLNDTNGKAKLKLMLLSDTTMLNKYGEPCGLDFDYLKNKLGNFTVERCATSVVQSLGHNRTWGCAIPVATMYEKGSVFSLRFDKSPPISAIRELEASGIGIRREEGFGQILFTDKLPATAVRRETKADVSGIVETTALTKEEEVMLKLLAKKHYGKLINDGIIRYVVTNAESGESRKHFAHASNSNLGVVLAMVKMLKYDTAHATSKLSYFFESMNTRNPKNAKGYVKTGEYVLNILNNNTDMQSLLSIGDNVFNYPYSSIISPTDELWYKLDLIEKEIKATAD